MRAIIFLPHSYFIFFYSFLFKIYILCSWDAGYFWTGGWSYKDFSYLFSLTGKGVTLGAKRARQVAITVETFLLVDRLVVIFLYNIRILHPP